MGRKRKTESKVDRCVERVVEMSKLSPHPRNYKVHPKDQIEHLRASLRQYGFYRRIVISSDNVILAGHGLYEAATQEGYTEAPVNQYGFDSNHPLALKLVALDNEIGNFAEVNDRMLTELLRDISKQTDLDGLMGTGFDEQMLAALVMVTRPEEEIANFDAAAEWTGLPEFDTGEGTMVLSIMCLNTKDRSKAIKKLGLDEAKGKPSKDGKILTFWFPPKEKDDLKSLAWKESEQ